VVNSQTESIRENKTEIKNNISQKSTINLENCNEAQILFRNLDFPVPIVDNELQCNIFETNLHMQPTIYQSYLRLDLQQYPKSIKISTEGTYNTMVYLTA
jgi:hypothetical protein